MKGPGGRQKFDVRRIWVCPRCQRRELTSGEVVQRACARCTPEVNAWMSLVEERAAGPVQAPATESGMSEDKPIPQAGTESA
jgi:hypothetical protein